jgi:peroxiredoxin
VFLADQKAPRATGRITQGRADVPDIGLPGMMIVEGSIASPAKNEQSTFAYSYNGKAFRVLNPATNTVDVIRLPTPYIVGGVVSQKSSGVNGISQFTVSQPWAAQPGETYTYEGTRNVQGIDCFVISREFVVNHPALGKVTIKSRWFIGRKDLLPRGSQVGSITSMVKILNINKPLTPDDYFVPVKEGFSERLVTGREPLTTGLLAEGDMAPEWTLLDALGKPHSLKDYRGKLVILDFWGIWCVPCRKTMPDLQALHQKYQNKGVSVIGVSVEDESDTAAFMKRLGYTYQLLVKGEQITEMYEVVTFPTIYVIGPDGKIIHAEFGFRR